MDNRPDGETLDEAVRVLKEAHARIQLLESRLKVAEEMVKVYENGYEARGELLGCYRIGRKPSEKLLSKLGEAVEQITAWNKTEETGCREAGLLDETITMSGTLIKVMPKTFGFMRMRLNL